MNVAMENMILIIGSLLVSAMIFVAGTQAATKLTDQEIGIITNQTTRAISSILINVASMEQGVRHFDLKKNFLYDLDETHIRLTYVGKTHTIRDELKTEHTFAVRHYRENIIENRITEGVDRICISKKIVNCEPQITICNEGQDCCIIDKSPCKYIK